MKKKYERKQMRNEERMEKDDGGSRKIK